MPQKPKDSIREHVQQLLVNPKQIFILYAAEIRNPDNMVTIILMNWIMRGFYPLLLDLAILVSFSQIITFPIFFSSIKADFISTFRPSFIFPQQA